MFRTDSLFEFARDMALVKVPKVDLEKGCGILVSGVMIFASQDRSGVHLIWQRGISEGGAGLCRGSNLTRVLRDSALGRCAGVTSGVFDKESVGCTRG